MAGYREITVAGGNGRARQPATKVRRPAKGGRSGWRAILTQALGHGLAEGTELCREKPGAVFGGVVALAAAVFVCVNALGAQTGRHPAPILPKITAKALPSTSDKAPARIAAKPAEAPAVAAEAAPAPKQVARDPIADLIRAEDTTASVTPKAKPVTLPKPEAAKEAVKPDASPAVDATVMRAQRALAKLGYGPVKADGAMGPATKAAIEKFEREHKLPVTGTAAGRTLRALESGATKG
ncbi:MAG: peptidoglycan-binding protein [Actinomycetospora chiangmaiensis]|nr:peptidoglycan-binding protein [Actinomycetospora chiangmaiensis]